MRVEVVGLVEFPDLIPQRVLDGVAALLAQAVRPHVPVFGADASTLRQAVDQVMRTARDATAGLVSGAPLSVEVVTDADLAEQLERPRVPELVDTTGAREILQVRTQQQMYELEQRNDFPAPVAIVSGGRRIYTVASIKAFGERWERKPGRPPKTRE